MHGRELHHVKSMRIGIEIKRQNAEQHEKAAGQRVQEKLDGRVFLTRAAPDSDEKIHGDKHHFPEHIEEEKIQGYESSHHAREQQKIQREIFFHPHLNPVRSHAGQKPEQSGEKNHGDGNTVNTQMVKHVHLRNPGHLFDELHAGITGVKLQGGYRGKKKYDSGNARRDLADKLRLGFGREQNGYHARDGKKHGCA